MLSRTPTRDSAMTLNDTDNDHSFRQLLEHKAMTGPEGQRAWAVALVGEGT